MPSPLAGKKKNNKNDKQPYCTGVIGGVVTPKHEAAEANLHCQHSFKGNLLDCLIKQHVRCIVFKYFFRATYYCNIIATIPSRKKVISNMSSMMVII